MAPLSRDSRAIDVERHAEDERRHGVRDGRARLLPRYLGMTPLPDHSSERAIRSSCASFPDHPHGYVTVGRLRDWLRSFNDDAVVVVPVSWGYEEPRMRLAEVTPVAVPQRYMAGADRPPQTVIVLEGVHR